MHQIFITMGPLTIRWYGVMAALGAFAGLFVIRKLKSYANLSENQSYDLLFWALISGIFGARLFYVIEFWDNFKNTPMEIVRVDHGGLVFYGGFIVALVAIFVFCRRNTLSFISVLDVCAPGIAVAHAFGRVGCFMNGCCFGKQTALPWGVVFPEGTDPFRFYCGKVPIHPVQLYEAIINVFVAFLLFHSVKKMKRGQTASLYLAVYGTARFLLEFLRGDHSDYLFGIFTPAQSIGIVLIPAGIAAFIFFGRKKDEKPVNGFL